MYADTLRVAFYSLRLLVRALWLTKDITSGEPWSLPALSNGND